MYQKFESCVRVAVLGVSLNLAPAAFSASISDLSGGYDVIVSGNATFDGVHIHGAIAIGGNLELKGNKSEFLMDNVSRPAGLTVKGSIDQKADGQIVRKGSLHVGSLNSGQSVVSKPGKNYLQSASGKKLYLEPNGGQTQTDVLSPAAVDMVASFNHLSALSASLAALDQTVSFGSFVKGSEFKFTLQSGSLVDFDVMNITGTQLASVQTLNFSKVSGSDQKLVINVDLSGYKGGAFAQNRNGDKEADYILWNFYGAPTLTLENQFIGTILAPDIALTHKNNDIKGSVIAGSFTKIGGQVHVHSFSNDFPEKTPASHSVPDGGSTGLLVLLMAPLLGLLHRFFPRSC